MEIEISVSKPEKAKEVYNLLKAHGCSVEGLKLPEDQREPIGIKGVCREEVANHLLENTKENTWKKLLPDELTPYPKWTPKKTRKII